jgi:DNA-binding GntR family transcriptional regulator
MVDHGSATPAYIQVADALRGKIRSGEYAPGQRLPSADDLAEIYEIAPNTARKSLQVLRDEGIAVMTPGLGTFVAGKRE